VPRWLILVGSLAIAFHLLMVGFGALAAPSGPWVQNEGQILMPPRLAFLVVSSESVQTYLKAIRMTADYHFPSNVTWLPGVYLEVRLKDEEGKEVAKVKMPDDNANPWVRHRQLLLAQQLRNDEPITRSPSEVIAAPGQKVPRVQFWEPDGPNRLKLKTTDINQVPLDRQVLGPSDWMFLLARSYARYLCRTHGAVRAEIIRHHQDPIRPFVLSGENVPAGAFAEITSNFGEFSR
jgi:hypothetical protein